MGQAQGKSGFPRREPTLERGRSRGTKGGQSQGNGPGRGARARIQGVSGAAVGGEMSGRTRKPRGPGKWHSPDTQVVERYSPNTQNKMLGADLSIVDY